MNWKTIVGFVGLFAVILVIGVLHGYYIEGKPASGLPAKSERCARCGNSMIIDLPTGKWRCVKCDGPLHSGGDADID